MAQGIGKKTRLCIGSIDFTAGLLENHGVAVVPGEAFGMPGHIRISYAVSKENLVNGFNKIAEAL
jgi:aspartate aminotransferase